MTGTIPTAAIRTDAVVAWIKAKCPGGPGAWGEHVLRPWLSARQDAGELWIVCVGGAPNAIGVAHEQPDGSVHVELMIAEAKDLWESLLSALMRRWPDWRDRRFTAIRKGRRRAFNVQRLIDRMEVRPWM